MNQVTPRAARHTAPDPGRPVRQRVMIAVRSTWHLRDLCESGLLDAMAKEFELSFLTMPHFDNNEYALANYGPLHFFEEDERAKGRPFAALRDWRRRDLNNIGFALMQISARQHMEDFENLVNRTTTHWWRVTRGIVYAAAYSGAGKVLAHLLRWWLRLTAAPIIPDDCTPDMIFMVSTPWNIDGHLDDVIRHARKRGIKVFNQQMNWDNISGKHYFEKPDFLGVYGMQSYIFAYALHGFPTHRISITGSPRFTALFGQLPDRATARARFGLPMDKRVLLYCLPTREYNHRYVLSTLNEAIATGRLPKDLHVFVKPHAGKTSIGAVTATEIDLDAWFNNLAHVSMFDDGERQGATPLKEFPYLYAAADGILSCYSTMVLEGLTVGLPALCIAYNDPDHPTNKFGFDWELTRYRLHLYGLRLSDAVALCDDKNDLLAACDRLLTLMARPDIAEIAKRSAECSVAGGETPSARRICETLKTIHRTGAVDGSAVLAPKGGFLKRLWLKLRRRNA